MVITSDAAVDTLTLFRAPTCMTPQGGPPVSTAGSKPPSPCGQHDCFSKTKASASPTSILTVLARASAHSKSATSIYSIQSLLISLGGCCQCPWANVLTSCFRFLGVGLVPSCSHSSNCLSQVLYI